MRASGMKIGKVGKLMTDLETRKRYQSNHDMPSYPPVALASERGFLGVC